MSDLPVLVLHLKNQRKFFSVIVVVRDDLGRHRKLTLTNHATVATLLGPDSDEATLPLQLGVGWQMVPVDLAALTVAVWGAAFKGVDMVRVQASCCVRKVFLSDRLYADVELPEYLRALG
jgi:hypothetical protein